MRWRWHHPDPKSLGPVGVFCVISNQAFLPCNCVTGRFGDFPAGYYGALHGFHPSVQPASVHGMCVLLQPLAFSQKVGEQQEGQAQVSDSASPIQRDRWSRWLRSIQGWKACCLFFLFIKNKLGWSHFYTWKISSIGRKNIHVQELLNCDHRYGVSL